jgi:hypothetical protein
MILQQMDDNRSGHPFAAGSKSMQRKSSVKRADLGSMGGREKLTARLKSQNQETKP